MRLGFRYAKGLREEAGRGIEAERRTAPFASLADFARRTGLRQSELDSLAHIGALGAFDLQRREALWQVSGIETDPRSLIARVEAAEEASPLPDMTPVEETLADYAGTSLTVGPHLLRHLRPRLRSRGVLSAAELRGARDGSFVLIAGHVIVRQRPGTAKGFLFLTLEDETGTANAVITPKTFEQNRALLHTAPILLIEGVVQNVDSVIHVRGRRFERVAIDAPTPPSHDFH